MRQYDTRLSRNDKRKNTLLLLVTLGLVTVYSAHTSRYHKTPLKHAASIFRSTQHSLRRNGILMSLRTGW